MRIPIYQADAFTSEVFGGNPAAVCPLESWLPDDILQGIALENNLSETAYYVPEGDGYRLRWFTPAVEVDLCGHATLATAHIMFTKGLHEGDSITFQSRSGPLHVSRRDDLIVMDFPEIPRSPADEDAGWLEEVIGQKPLAVQRAGHRRLVLLENEAAVRSASPDLAKLKAADTGLILTAPGDDCDCASRYFTPSRGIDEDPVTGSAHCVIAPYWAEKLGRTDIHARQVSARGGELFCRVLGDRVEIAGRAAYYLEGVITI
jgi:PhzF family phenazine biosynthesis protein